MTDDSRRESGERSAWDRRRFLAATGALATGAVGFSTGASAATKDFETEQRVSPIVWTQTYAAPDSSSRERGLVGPDVAGYVRDGPESDEDQRFWLVEYNTGKRGWTTETNIEPAPLATIDDGTRVELAHDAAGHRDPGPDTDVKRIFDGGLEGYARNDGVDDGGYTWYRVDLNTGESAWFARRHLDVDPTIFDWDDPVAPNVDSTVYAGHSKDAESLGVVSAGTVGRIRKGPEEGGDFLWWRVEFPDVTGWVVQTNLKHADPPENVVRGPDEAIIQDVPYFYQYYNDVDPSGTCGNTSMSILLNFYGWDGSPDYLSRRFGDAQSTRPPGASAAFNAIAEEIGIDQRVDGSTTAHFDDLRGWIDQGKPVAVWGMFTPPGHILVVTGYDGDQWVCNDPAGHWNGEYQGTHYGGADAGRYVRYDADLFENAVNVGGNLTVVYPE